MLKTKLLLSAVAVLLLSACGKSDATASGPDMIIGTWQGTDSPTTCPMTAITIASDSFTFVQDGASHPSRVLGIGLQGNNPSEINVMTSHENVFHVIDNNHIQLYTPFAQCSYTRTG